MPTVAVTDQYIVLLSITTLFTILALLEDESNPKNLIIEFLAAVTWFTSAYAHFTVGDTASLLTIPITYLFAGLGLIFALSGILNATQLVAKKKVSI